MQPYGIRNYPPPGDPGDLDLPYYDIGFLDAIRRYFAKYARFDGRASRGEFGWPLLLDAIVGAVVLITCLIAATVGATDPGNDYVPLQATGERIGLAILIAWGMYFLATLVPRISVQVRRLHDAGHSGWFVLLRLLTGGDLALIIASLALGSNPAGTAYDRWKEAR